MKGPEYIEFSYLYRDSGNYKNYGSVYMHNSKRKPLETLEKEMHSYLIDQDFFYAKDIGVPHLFFEDSTPDDVTWHEFIELLEASPEEKPDLDIENVLPLIKDKY